MKQLIQKCEQLGITLSNKQIEQFQQYYEMLVETNKVMNLTAITELSEVIDKHFVDSLSICKVLDMSKPYRILDVGTGAGFPGIPLKIAFPQLDVVLLDSLGKRVRFLNEVIIQLGITSISAYHGRAEDYAKQKDFREQFDVVVSRAVANLATLSEYCMPYVKVGGMFISYKSGKAKEELADAEKAITTLGGELLEAIDFVLPDTEINRTFVNIKKTRNTPGKYPRKAGLPSKEPLGSL